MNRDFASRRVRRWAFAAALSACWCGLGSHRAAHAEPVDLAARARTGGVIALVFDPNRREAAAAVRAIESHLSGMGVVVVEERVTRSGDLLAWLDTAQERARSRNALGVFAIDADAGSEVRVFFSEPDGEATLIRRIRSKPAGARVGLEEAAIVVRSIVEALRDGGHVGMVEPRPVEEPKPVEPARPVEPRRPPVPSQPPEAKHEETFELTRDTTDDPADEAELDAIVMDEAAPNDVFYTPPSRGPGRLSLGLSAAATSWAVDEGWQFGPAVAVQFRLTNALRAELEYFWFSSLRVERNETTFALTRHPLAASLTYTPFIGLSPLFQAGMFVDAVSRRTESATGTLQGTGDDDRWIWGFSGRVGVTATLAQFLHPRLIGGLDVPTSQLDYVVAGGSRRTLLSMRSVRPHLEASIQADVW